jgi:hypothetical protein
VNRLPFAMPGRFWRGNLHTHSTRSDGRLSPSETAAWYRDNGYDFVALTDHFVRRYRYPITDTTPFRTGAFTTLIGAEMHGPRTQVGNLWHLVAAGLPLDFAPPVPGETGPQLAARAAAGGAFVIVAHPAYYGLTVSDVESVGAAHALEIYNGASALAYEMGDSGHILDVLISRGRRIDACATDDAHFEHPEYPDYPDHGLGWVNVRAQENDPVALVEALRAGHFYASEGPELLDVSIEQDEVVVSSSPVMKVIVSGGAERYECRYGDGLTQTRVPLTSFHNGGFEVDPVRGRYIRITVVDARRRRAWTNPIWLG